MKYLNGCIRRKIVETLQEENTDGRYLMMHSGSIVVTLGRNINDRASKSARRGFLDQVTAEMDL